MYSPKHRRLTALVMSAGGFFLDTIWCSITQTQPERRLSYVRPRPASAWTGFDVPKREPRRDREHFHDAARFDAVRPSGFPDGRQPGLLVFNPVKLLRTVQGALGAKSPRADLRNGRARIIKGAGNRAGTHEDE